MTEQADRLHGRIAGYADRLARQARQAGTAPILDLALVNEIKLPWFEVRSHATRAAAGQPDDTPPDEGVATVYILDQIGGSMGIEASSLVREIDDITEPTIHIRINSPGGSVFDALAIYNALNHHPAHKVTYVDGLAASAASIIAMAGDEIVVMPGGQMMIHDASAPGDGNQADHEHLATFLGRQSDNAASLYQARAGGTADEWRSLMLAETWMFGDEAVAMGLADKVETPPRAAEPELVDALARSHDLAPYCYRGRRTEPRRLAPGERLVHRSVKVTDRTAPDASDRSEPAVELAAAAASRGEATERRAHALAQEGRSVPVLRTSDQFRTQLRVARSEMPSELGAARLQGFNSRLQRASSVQRNGRELVHIAGYASMYGQQNSYEMWDAHGPYLEWVRPRAGQLSLAKSPDVAFLVNHLGMTMARTKAGTLDLADDADGLADDAYVNPDRSDVQDLLLAIDEGSVTEQSFAFMIDQGAWSEDFVSFCIVQYDINRGDVSAVSFGANPFTSIAARGQQILADLDRMPAGLATAAYARLGRRTDVAGERLVRPAPAEPAPVRTVDREPVAAGRRITHIEALLGD